MTQQTAINWLRKKLEETYDKEGKLPLAYTFSLLNKAEQMEKEQIQDAWHDGNFLGRNGNLFVDYNTKEGYYKSEFENK